MKTIIAKVQIQFDQFSDGNSEQYTMETIERINEVLQREFNDISPIIFGNNIDSSDIEVATEEDEDEDYQSEWVCTDPDNKQYGRQLSENKFEFREKNHNVKEYNDEEIEMTIDLDDYNEERQRYYALGYYNSLEHLKEEYGDQWKWILAECIFEQESGLY